MAARFQRANRSLVAVIPAPGAAAARRYPAPQCPCHLHPVGDRGELATIRQVFGSGTDPSITATKSTLGHMLSAASGAAAIFTLLALRDQMAPPVLNLDNPAPLAEGLDLTRGSARARAMLNAFGGVNASLVLNRYEDKVAASNLSTDPDT